MKIFYINTDKFSIDEEFLNTFAGKFGPTEKQKQHCFGRFLVMTAAKEFYNLEDTQIEIVNKKPRFVGSRIQFSISHSKNIVLAAFDQNPVGADIEFMKERNFKELFERYNYKVSDASKELFYEFWTEYEAGIKLQGTYKSKITVTFLNDFMLTVAGNFTPEYEVYELTENGFSCI